MNTSQSLSDADRTLLLQAVSDGFSLPTLLSRAPDAHPAQRDMLTLLEWFDLPHIKAAAQRAVDIVADIDRYAAAATLRPLREKLINLFSLAFDSVADSRHSLCTSPAKSASAIHATCSRTIRETRFITQQILRLSGVPARPRNTKNQLHDTLATDNLTSNAAHDSTSDPNSISTSSRTNSASHHSIPHTISDTANDTSLNPNTPLHAQLASTLTTFADLTTQPTNSPRAHALSASSLHSTAGTARTAHNAAPTSRPLPLHMNLPHPQARHSSHHTSASPPLHDTSPPPPRNLCALT